MAESFFATLECELLARTSLSTHAAARAAVFDFVEGWYNTRRRHSALGYVSPLEFETSPCGRTCGRGPAGGGSAGAHESGGARIAGDDSRRHRPCCGGLRPVT